ncbi:MAG: hypothetical protein RMJ98_03800 [Myxococcales bacterium]|nr:hypothetical protein [Polyangiaceae bacterium]MDW8248413.1 hypothetical protein [Myxococcales bacterium]
MLRLHPPERILACEVIMQIFDRIESNVRSYCRQFPAVFSRAIGAQIFDDQGRRYLDFSLERGRSIMDIILPQSVVA